MSPALDELITVLERESDLLKELVQLLQDDQERLIKHDVAALEGSNRRKEEVVLRFQSLEGSRLGLTQQLGTSLGLTTEELRISKICAQLGPEGKDLENAAQKLRALVGSLQELVAVSRGFLEQSILGIRSLLALIQSLQTPDPQTYGSTGQFERSSEPEAMTVRREV
jgi:flagellar biosynthesis/type III secretory pathway chaperone